MIIPYCLNKIFLSENTKTYHQRLPQNTEMETAKISRTDPITTPTTNQTPEITKK